MALDYTQKVIELFRNPKNVGEIDSPDVEVKEGSPACGDLLQLQLKINPISKIIDDIKFKSFGCASNIATASIVTEMAKGEKMEWDDEQFRKSEQFLKIQLKALMARDLFDSSAYFVIINDENDLFREGLTTDNFFSPQVVQDGKLPLEHGAVQRVQPA